jgi:spore maturation protein CgeB
MLVVVYSFNKTGMEARHWEAELSAASTPELRIVPFNHGRYVGAGMSADAVKLDQCYQRRDPAVLDLHRAIEQCVRDNQADALFVTNSPPYHPDFLRTLPVYRVLYTTDDPGATYMRTIPYLHAYHHVMHCCPTYSADMDLGEKLRYAGARNVDWLPLSIFDFEFEAAADEATVLGRERNIDVAYVGSFFRQKSAVLAEIKKRLGRRLRMHGFFRAKHNLWWNVKFGAPGWIRPIGFDERVRLYQRTKIGFNLHWNEYGLGNQRLYHLPANGVMQISDCADHVGRIYEPGAEIETWRTVDELIAKIEHYLEHDDERRRMATNAYRRTMSQYRIGHVTRDAAQMIAAGMRRSEWKRG